MNAVDVILLAVMVALLFARANGSWPSASVGRRARRLRDQSQRIHDDTCRLIAAMRA